MYLKCLTISSTRMLVFLTATMVTRSTSLWNVLVVACASRRQANVDASLASLERRASEVSISLSYLSICCMKLLTHAHSPPSSPPHSFFLTAICPNSCSGHGSCQTELRFAVAGMTSNAAVFTNYEKDQQYGCKCDIGYRGADCSQVECPSGADVMGADGGAEGMDCSGRGLCDYSAGSCSCFKGFYGERCEQQTTLV